MAKNFIKPRPRYEHRMNKSLIVQLFMDIFQQAALPLVKELGNVCKMELKEEGIDLENMVNPQSKN